MTQPTSDGFQKNLFERISPEEYNRMSPAMQAYVMEVLGAKTASLKDEELLWSQLTQEEQERAKILALELFPYDYKKRKK